MNLHKDGHKKFTIFVCASILTPIQPRHILKLFAHAINVSSAAAKEKHMKLPFLFKSLDDNAIHLANEVAIVTDTSEWSYKQLWARLARFESALAAVALPSRVAVAVTANKTVDTLALMLALGKQGHTPLAVSPALGSAVKQAMYGTAGVYCELAAESNSDWPAVNLTASIKMKAEAATGVYPPDTCPLMLTTSGSTGIPKVVQLSEEGVSTFFEWGAEYFQLAPGTRVLSYAPLNFDLSLLEIWAPLAKGATVILADTARATQANYLHALIRDSRPDIIQAVPMFYSLLCPAFEPSGLVMRGTRHVIFTGEHTPQKLRELVSVRFPLATFHNIYGCTETNDSFVYSVDAQAIVRDERLPLGQPIDGVTYRIVTDEGTLLVGAGEGELHTSTPFVAHGYSDPELTVKVFYTERPSGRTYYRTGDRVARDEHGQLTLIGRNDFIVKVRGVRTNLLDIEQVLTKIPDIKSAVVIPVKDEIAGTVLHAVLEPMKGQRLCGIAMRTLCAENLPQTSIPSRFHFHEGSLPTTSTGKPDRKAIAVSIQSKRNELA